MRKAVKKSVKVRVKTKQASFRLSVPLLEAFDNFWNISGMGENVDRTEVFRKVLTRVLEEEQRFLVRSGYGIDRKNNLVFFHNGKFAIAELKYAPEFYDSFVEAMASIGSSGEIQGITKL
jgi:hypothetical protein